MYIKLMCILNKSVYIKFNYKCIYPILHPTIFYWVYKILFLLTDDHKNCYRMCDLF